MKRKTSPGHDDIPTCTILDGVDEIAAPLLGSIFFTSFCKICKIGVREVIDSFDYQSGKTKEIVREF